MTVISFMSSDQFSSVQFRSRCYPCARESPHALHPVTLEFPPWCLWNNSNVSLIDDGPFSSSQGRSLTSSSFDVSLLRAIYGVMSLALCPQVVSQAPQRLKSSETKAACAGCCARQTIWAPPWLVFGDWAISVDYDILRLAVFLNEMPDLGIRFACWPFSTVSSPVGSAVSTIHCHKGACWGHRLCTLALWCARSACCCSILALWAWTVWWQLSLCVCSALLPRRGCEQWGTRDKWMYGRPPAHSQWYASIVWCKHVCPTFPWTCLIQVQSQQWPRVHFLTLELLSGIHYHSTSELPKTYIPLNHLS